MPNHHDAYDHVAYQEYRDNYAHAIDAFRQWKTPLSIAGIYATIYLLDNPHHAHAKQLLNLAFNAPVFDRSTAAWQHHLDSIGTVLDKMDAHDVSMHFAHDEIVLAAVSLKGTLAWHAAHFASDTAPPVPTVGDWSMSQMVTYMRVKLVDNATIEHGRQIIKPWRAFDSNTDTNNVRAFYALAAAGHVKRALTIIKF